MYPLLVKHGGLPIYLAHAQPQTCNFWCLYIPAASFAFWQKLFKKIHHMNPIYGSSIEIPSLSPWNHHFSRWTPPVFHRSFHGCWCDLGIPPATDAKVMASFWSELSKPKPAANYFAKNKTRQIGQWFCSLTIAVFYKMSVCSSILGCNQYDAVMFFTL